jgi:hypothetical protein
MAAAQADAGAVAQNEKDDDERPSSSVNTALPAVPLFISGLPIESEGAAALVGREACMLWDDGEIYLCRVYRHLGLRRYELFFPRDETITTVDLDRPEDNKVVWTEASECGERWYQVSSVHVSHALTGDG